nr:hypothetical protein [Propionibacterium sp.]
MTSDRARRAPARLLAALVLGALAACTATPAGPASPPAAPGPSASPVDRQPEGRGWVAAENERPGTPGWEAAEATYAADRELAGYFGQVSVEPGEPATLYATSRVGDFDVIAYRLGWYSGAGAREVWRSPVPVTGVEQGPPLMAADRTITTDWRPSATLPTVGWPEGSYLVELSAQAGRKTRYVPLTVRSRSSAGRLVLMSAVLSYQAYNAWGGYSLYLGPDGRFRSRSARVSFDRPYDRNGAMEVFKWEVPVVQHAERLGLDLAYTTTWDVAQRPGTLDDARGVVSEGHDEYWPVSLRDAVEAARDAGANLAFLGANALYWRVRLEEGPLGPGRTMVGFKDSGQDPVQGPETTTRWRSRPWPRPENSLTGMLYECYPARGALRVEEGDFFLFRGTGAATGDEFPGLLGDEIDRAYPIAGTPPSLEVVAHSKVRCEDVGWTYADMTYYTTASGAGVFATGTMMWVNALASRTAGTGLTPASVSFARGVTDNLLRAMAAGPMGIEHPARPNLAALEASPSTAHGSAGEVDRPDTATPGPRSAPV